MRITDELRAYIRGHSWESLTAIADRIDAALRERYIELPKDADGEVIHIGDVMEWECPPHEPFDVIGIGRNGTLFYRTDEGASSALWTTARNKRHHHEQTVEDVLEEYRIKYYDLVTDVECENITNEEYTQGISSLNAEYAAKLQLKESE